MVNLDRCNGRCNTFDDSSSRICISIKTEKLNLSVFNMIRRISESKKLRKHISCKCKYKFGGTKCNVDPKWNEELCRCQRKNFRKHHVCTNIIVGILVDVLGKMVNN